MCIISTSSTHYFNVQILMSVLRVLMCVILMLSALMQSAVTTAIVLWVTLGMEEAVVRMKYS